MSASQARTSSLDDFVAKHPQARGSKANGASHKVQEPETFKEMLGKLQTKAGVIRYLTSLGKYSRQAIADFADSNYQYVRAVQLQSTEGVGDRGGAHKAA